MIAHSAWLRLIIGGALSGFSVAALLWQYPQAVGISVNIAVLFGAMRCVACELIGEALVVGFIAAVAIYAMLWLAPKFMAGEPRWWASALLGVPIGVFGGAAVGGILGGIFRCLWDQNLSYDDQYNCRPQPRGGVETGDR